MVTKLNSLGRHVVGFARPRGAHPLLCVLPKTHTNVCRALGKCLGQVSKRSSRPERSFKIIQGRQSISGRPTKPGTGQFAVLGRGA